jgi:hypothetical protein
MVLLVTKVIRFAGDQDDLKVFARKRIDEITWFVYKRWSYKGL